VNGDLIVSLVGVLAALVLAVQGLRGRRERPRRWFIMAAAWVGIIVIATLIMRYLEGAQA
jgi:hypothetical protein